MSGREPSFEEIEALRLRLEREAGEGGYRLNPDVDFVRDLMRGLLINRERYGYPSCPCRLAAGEAGRDRDIVCPCDYRDPDLGEWGACYCALYVTAEAAEGKRKIGSVPERRPSREVRDAGGGARPPLAGAPAASLPLTDLPYPVWRCRVCGYLCAREGPPQVCPVCKATKDRFERFL
jgi:ferredoxin-thioredoxin reductase catalytic chain